MKENLQISVCSFSDISLDVQKLLIHSASGSVLKDKTRYFRMGDLVFYGEAGSASDLLLHPKGSSFSADLLSESELLLHTLEGEIDPSALIRIGIPDHASRCVMIIHPEQNTDGRMFLHAIPLEDGDRITERTNGDAVFIMRMDRRTRDEVFEFAEAASVTMESEAGISCRIGIGRTVESLSDLPESYREADTALATGLSRKLSGHVYAFERQLLERIAESVSPESASGLLQTILPPEKKKYLSAEMMETIRVFFQNDLNLSTTARQLFLHRNTLLYRMEKIKKITGLDLRKFEDAAAFRILMSISDNLSAAKHNS